MPRMNHCGEHLRDTESRRLQKIQCDEHPQGLQLDVLMMSGGGRHPREAVELLRTRLTPAAVVCAGPRRRGLRGVEHLMTIRCRLA